MQVLQFAVHGRTTVPAESGGVLQVRLSDMGSDALVGAPRLFRNVHQSSFPLVSDVRIMPHLDHGMPDVDRTLLHDFADQFATSMHDCSHLPFEQNVRRTAEYVAAVKGKTLVEGAVDEISEVGASGEEQLTTVEQAQRFLSETGCAFIVPNLGTEHRATGGEVKYYANRAKEISAAVGKILVLHGTSSLGQGALQNLSDDGIVKVNIWTRLATSGGKAIARHGIEPSRPNPAEGSDMGVRSGGFHEGVRFPLNAETGRIPVDMFKGRQAENVEQLLTMIAETKTALFSCSLMKSMTSISLRTPFNAKYSG